MKHRCPHCGNLIKSGLYCNVCLERIEPFKVFWDTSAFYYNQGLKASKNRELSLAAVYLHKAVMLYKYNTKARNLLGLVYFELGQIGSALKEWIISTSLEKEDNIAFYYIEQIQKQPKFLANGKEAIVLYNKSLVYMQQENLDMAIIRLKKSVNINPNLVEARALLALAYMKQGQFRKASEQVNKALGVDRSHKIILAYFKELSKEKLEELEPYERDYSKQSQQQYLKQSKVEADIHKVLNQGAYYRRYVGYFILGAIGMFIITKCLVLPNEVNQYKEEIAILKEAKETLSEEIETLSQEETIKVTELEDENEKLQDKVKNYEEQLAVFEQKDKLTRVQSMIKERAYEEAAQILYNVAITRLDEADMETLISLKASVYPRVTESLYNQAVSLYSTENYIESVMQFETLMQYEPNDRIARKSLYYLGQICEQNEDLDGAKKYYNKILTEYPKTSEAYKSDDRLKALSSIN